MKLLLLSILISFSIAAESSGLQQLLKTNENRVMNRFRHHHRQFSQEVCRPGTEEKFWKLFRAYQGSGYYLPRTVDDQLDRKTLNRFFPELLKKKKWIQGQKEKLKKVKSFKSLKTELSALKDNVDELVKFKEAYAESQNDSEKISIKNKSKYKFLVFKKKFLDFLHKVPFLTSYRYPVDHFELRENYDEVKGSDEPDKKLRANEVYFYRKIVQDGAHNPNRSHSDRFLRAMLDTLTIKMKDNPNFIPEDVRYDLNSAFYGLEKQLRRGPKKQARRLWEWEKRMTSMIDFYESMKKNKVKVGSKYESGDNLIKLQVKARAELKNYVLEKHKEVYNYWTKKAEVHQALYSLVTILYNEVGGVDGRHALDRRDVTQVVINRVGNGKYNFIPTSDWLHSYLSSKSEGIVSNPWLNVMFKEGEFSFTYYFIHGAVRVFCPDQTKIGKRLRSKNLGLSVEGLQKNRGTFAGLRYFSRASMLGRISMDRIWSEYRAVPERVGVPIEKKRASILSRYKKGDYKPRYYFKDVSGKKMKVIEIDDDVYVLNPVTFDLYTYRNPHYFRYFEPVK